MFIIGAVLEDTLLSGVSHRVSLMWINNRNLWDLPNSLLLIVTFL